VGKKVAYWSTKVAISLKRVKIKEIGSHQYSFDFLGRRHISTSGFASTATETAFFALILPAQPSNQH